MKRRIDKLVYEFDLSIRSRIYSVISITQLESADLSIDSYSRSIFDHSNSVNREQYDLDVSQSQVSYEIEKVIDRQKRTYDKRVI